MAIASSPRVAPAESPRPEKTALRRWLPALATIVGVAVAIRLVFDTSYMNYDARYALLWARDFWDGLNPDFLAQWAPTPHPLSTAISSLALPFGDSGDQVIVWLMLLGFGVLVWLSYRLGATLFNHWAGVAVAVVVATRPALLRDVQLGYQDVWFEALIVGAVLLEAQRPRRGVPVLVLLALAGLLRPEAWVLSALYWAWLWPVSAPRRRVLYAALVASAPLIWALMDLIVTGNALHSLHGTADLAIENERRRGIDQVPRWTAQYYGFTLREPLLIGIPIGMFFAWRFRCRQLLLPLAVIVAMTVVFALSPVFGLPLIGRYLRTPSVLLILFYGLAIFGWLLLREGSRERRIWKWVGLGAALLSVAWLPWHVKKLDSVKIRSERESALYQDLRKVGEARVVRAAFGACPKLSAADHRPVPYLRWWIDGDPLSINTVEPGYGPLRKLLLVPRRTSFYARRFYRGTGTYRRVKPPPNYVEIYKNRSWKMFADRACAP
jgi:hypothetical protein